MAAQLSLTLVLGLALLVVSAMSGPVLRAPECGWNDVFLPDPTSCSHYYMCSNGWPTRLACAEGLHWDQERTICTLPAEANCQVVGTTPSPTEAPLPTTAGPTYPDAPEGQ